jgi:hypothetical protein
MTQYKGCNKSVSVYGNVRLKLCPFCNKKRLQEDKEPKKPTGEAALFEAIWSTRKHVSFISNQPLDMYRGTDLWYNLFAHVLEKAQNRYPKFKLYDKNIVLLTPREHDLYDKGTAEQRAKYAEETGADWNKLFELRKELIEEYGK